MESYSEALRRYVKANKNQAKLAEAINRTQPSVSRYAAGASFPDAQTARDIDVHTGGEVPFELWQSEALTRLGIAA